MAKGTVALPTLYNVRLRQAVRIAVGIRREGKGAPQKLDHFVLTRWSPQAKSYVIDREAMQALGEEKPTRLPVLVMANLEVVPDAVTGEPRLEVPQSILRTRMAYYWGSRCQCASEDFMLKPRAVCEREGIDFPPDPDFIGSWIGRARVRQYNDAGRKVAERKRGCNPVRCPMATGEGNTKNPGVPLCRPQTIFTCMLPCMARLGVAAKFVTTSWRSTALLRSSLLHIGALNRGWLAMLPLELVVSVERVSSEGYTAPVVNIEFAGNQLELLETTARVKEQLIGYERQIAALDDGHDFLELESGEMAEAYAREFTSETAEEDAAAAPGIEYMTTGYLAALAAEAGWTDAQIRAALDAAGGDEDEVIAQLEAATGRGVVDADFENPEGEAPGEYAPDAGESAPPDVDWSMEESPSPDDYEELFPDAPEVKAARAKAGGAKRLIEEGE